ncbi:hypothetical protein RW64_13395 [Geobacter sulfurreducens]|nr:hypothetical protein RW64_13395 [Geobacter sulfurreducens]
MRAQRLGDGSQRGIVCLQGLCRQLARSHKDPSRCAVGDQVNSAQAMPVFQNVAHLDYPVPAAAEPHHLDSGAVRPCQPLDILHRGVDKDDLVPTTGRCHGGEYRQQKQEK